MVSDFDLIGPGRHVGVAGQTQTGKSYWTQAAIAHGSYDCLIYDPDDEYAPGESVRSISQAIRIMERAKSGGGRALVVVSTGTYSRSRMADEVEILARYAYEVGDMVLVIDEAGESARRNVMPESLYKCARRGAKRGVGLVVVSQRLTDIDTELNSQLSKHVLFRLSEESDAVHTRKRWGSRASDMIRRLPPRHYLVMPDDATDVDQTGDYWQNGGEPGRTV